MKNKFRIVVMLLLAGLCTLAAQGPDWWQKYQAVQPVPGGSEDDFTAANVGQLKNLAAQGYYALAYTMPEGSQLEELRAMIRAFKTGTQDDFVAINVGQAKAVAKPFYTVLMAAGLVAELPWDDDPAAVSTQENFALLNVGQLKHLFAFSVPEGTASVLRFGADSDGDGLPDEWEWRFLGTLAWDGASDPDQDRRNNLREWMEQSDPDFSNSLTTVTSLQVLSLLERGGNTVLPPSH